MSIAVRSNLIDFPAAFPLRADDLARLDERMESTEYSQYRTEAFDRASALDIPSSSDEMWRYTNAQLYPLGAFREASPLSLSIDESSTFEEGQVTIRTPIDADLHLKALIARLITCEKSEDGFSWLQRAATSSVHIITIRKGEKNSEPARIRLRQILSQVDAVCSSPLILIDIEDGATAELIEDLTFDDARGASFLFAPRMEFFLGRDSSVTFASLQGLPRSAHYAARHHFHLERNAKLKSLHLALGSKVARVDLECFLTEPGGSADMYALYLADGKRHVDLHTVQHHIAPDCRSELYAKGALKDSSRSVYYGYIRVAENAFKTDAYQTSRNLMLSPGARADAIPNLEIKANDVKCSHGASVGQVGAEELFYLRSRGLKQDVAERLIVQGFFEDLVSRLGNEELRETVVSRVRAQITASTSR